MKKLNICASVVCAALITACGGKKEEVSLTASGLNPNDFVAEYNGKPTALYTLTNDNGMEVCITNFGGRIVSISVPDRDGNLQDVVLGFDKVSDYFPENNQSDFGAAIGRYANRINQGQLVIDGETIQLPQNNFGHCLHGGPTGWQYQVYDVKEATPTSLTLALNSPDGDNNFPGNVDATVVYTLTPDNKLDIAYSATTDKPTVVNMTNHSYFNLSGNPEQPITDHLLCINASQYTPVDSTFMTTGEILAVEGTPMDFTTIHAIGDNINDTANEQISNGNGYDHNWVLETAGNIFVPAAVLYSPTTGIVATVYTTEPGIQVYTGNFLDGTVTGKKGIVYNQRAAVCLETQHYPDSPNKPEWPSTLLNPGETYSSNTVYQFGIQE